MFAQELLSCAEREPEGRLNSELSNSLGPDWKQKFSLDNQLLTKDSTFLAVLATESLDMFDNTPNPFDPPPVKLSKVLIANQVSTDYSKKSSDNKMKQSSRIMVENKFKSIITQSTELNRIDQIKSCLYELDNESDSDDK